MKSIYLIAVSLIITSTPAFAQSGTWGPDVDVNKLQKGTLAATIACPVGMVVLAVARPSTSVTGLAATCVFAGGVAGVVTYDIADGADVPSSRDLHEQETE